MAEPLADQVLRKISEARELYHRLILMVGPAGGRKPSSRCSPGRSRSRSHLRICARPFLKEEPPATRKR